MIVERLAEGKAIAKHNPDYREGRPKKFTKKQVAHALQLLEKNPIRKWKKFQGFLKAH